MRKIVSAKILGTEKIIIGYLIDVGTGSFVSTYSVITSSNTKVSLEVKRVDSESIEFLMYEERKKNVK